MALCKDCHQGSRNGFHGQRQMWKLKKMDEYDALNVTIERVMQLVMNGGVVEVLDEERPF